MPNEVTKDAEENVEKQISATEQTNEEKTVETSAAENKTATETTEETKSAEQKSAEQESAEQESAEQESAMSAEAAEENSAPNAKVEEPNASAEKAEESNTSAENVEESNASTEMQADKTNPSDNKQEADEMDFGAILEQFEQEQTTFHAGELVKGKIVDLSDQGALVDFGYKSEGTVGLDEITDDNGELKVKQGEEVEVVIKSMGMGENPPSLSLFDAKRRRSWNEIETAFNEEAIITGTVRSKTKGGLKVDINGVEAFLPGSQVDSRPIRNLDVYIGEEIETKVIKFSRKRNNIVLSRKVITDEAVNAEKEETLNNIKQGYIVEGTVKNLTDYGAFVDIGGIDGLLHVTDMSWGRLHNPNQMFNVADHVQVKILKLDRAKEKVSLGYKQLMPDPWTTVTELYPVNATINGKVSSVTEYGAFVELEPGVEGLVHVSEMSWSKRLKHPKHIVRKGQDVEVQVLGIDPDERRISLGIKQLQDNPWDTIAERFKVGSQVKGQVRNLTDFGAFVEIEEGVDGLVHVSDISWSKKIKHPKDVLKKGQEVEAVITNMDIEGRRLSLSIKELTPSVWDDFTTKYHAGDVVKGKISRFASFGVFVELAPDLEGLCHISELSDDRIENPEDQFEIGQELDFKILRIEQDVEKIGLSHRAVGKDDEAKVIESSKSYSSQAKGGMASLGELANLKFGGKNEEAKAEETSDDKPEKVEETKAESIKEELEIDDSAKKAEETTADVKEETAVEETAVEETEEATAETTEDAVAETSVDENTAETEDAKAEESVEAKGETEDVKAEDTAESEEKIADEKAEVAEETSAASEVESDSAETSDETEQKDSSEAEAEATTDDAENEEKASAETPDDEDKKKKKGAKS